MTLQTRQHPRTPASGAMTIWHEAPYSAAANTPLDQTMSSWLHIRRSDGTAGALTTAGIVAVVDAVSGYLSALSDTARAAIADRAPGGGLELRVTRTEVSVPVAPGDADAFASVLADVLGDDDNVMEDPSS